ncbi:MAG: MoxR family ATPase [Anaerolineae bacterium]|nr:MoxR family ATPase [Anaerolineae bacterium]
MSYPDPPSITVEQFRETATRIEAEISRVIVGQKAIVRHVLIGLIAGGHVLLEGVPGLGKTMLVRTLADALELQFSRIQFTPDLMPADIVGTDILEEDEQSGARTFRFQPGPVFSNLVLADEINRATPKTQSALLEAMQEHHVTVSKTTYTLPAPFFVLATQNPIEMEGTYPLPEAQLDRFTFKLNVRFPAADELTEILNRTTQQVEPKAGKAATGETILAMGELARGVAIASHVNEYAVRLLLATHPDNEHAPAAVRRFVRYGASPRGAQAMILGSKIGVLLGERYNVSFEDLQAMAFPALRHRIILNFEGEAEGISTDDVIGEIVKRVTP